MQSEYLTKLSGDVKTRYIKKIEKIENYDPYALTDIDFSENVSSVPSVTIVDIVSYFIQSHSFDTAKQVKAYKSLEAYKFYKAGFVVKVKCKEFNGTFLLLSEVKYSQRMNDTNLRPWLILNDDGLFESAHCTCMAGLGEVCSHIAAVAFFLLHRPNSETLSCTDQLSIWPVPPVSRAIIPQKISDIDWGRNSDYYDACLDNVPAIQGESLMRFLEEIEESESDAAILRVIEPFASWRIAHEIRNLPLPLTDLYNEMYTNFTLEDLLQVEVDVSITEEQRIAVFEKTGTQSKCISWYTYKAGRISASMFKSVCNTSLEKPSLSVIKSICYPMSRTFKTKATEYGLKHEDKARADYQNLMERHHRNFRVATAGFVISQDYPVLGASPDGLTTCDCCPVGCVEIKCPYRMKSPDITMEDFSLMERSFLRREDDGAFSLDRQHAYFYQIHLQMHATRTTHCDFIVWSKNHLSVERIYFDRDFFVEKLEKALEFHKLVIIPEILGRWYTMSKDRRVEKELWSDCREEDNGDDMILCSNDECKIKWFHEKCVSLPNASSVYWFCRTCSIEIFGV